MTAAMRLHCFEFAFHAFEWDLAIGFLALIFPVRECVI